MSASSDPPRGPPPAGAEERARDSIRKMAENVHAQPINRPLAIEMAADAVCNDFGLPPAMALDILRSEWNARFAVKWTDAEISAAIAEAEAHPIEHRGFAARPLRVVPDNGLPAPRIDVQTILGIQPTITGGALSGGPTNLEWERGLLLTDTMRVKSTLGNVIKILDHDAAVAGAFAFNVFADRIVIRKTSTATDPPWRGATAGLLTDAGVPRIVQWFEECWKLTPGVDMIKSALEAVARANTFDPLLDYLNGLAWDGTPRLDDWLTDCFGVPKTPLTQAFGHRWPISAVARAFDPGCQCDYTLVLEGKQGIRKSSALRTLAGTEWFTDSLEHITKKKDSEIGLIGRWIIEFAEMDALSGAKLSTAKAFLTCRSDRFRGLFEKWASDHPRRCAFVASTNQHQYLTDDTGNRRYWPVACEVVNLDWLAEQRDQIWAEAVRRYKDGEPWWLRPDELVAEVAAAQGMRVKDDLWEIVLADKTEAMDSLTMLDAARFLELPIKECEGRPSWRIASILRSLGFEQKRARTDGARSRVWIRISPPESSA